MTPATLGLPYWILMASAADQAHADMVVLHQRQENARLRAYCLSMWIDTAWPPGFAVSAVALLAVRGRPRPARTGRSVLAEAREGLRYCSSQRWLWITIAGLGAANFVAFGPLPLLVPLLIKDVLRAGAPVFGLVTASSGAGGLIASVVAGRLGAPRRRMTVIWVGWGLAGAAVAALGLVPDAWVAGLLVAFCWAMVMYGTVLWNSLMQERVPAALLGRASSVERLVSYVGSPVGVLAAGAAAGAVGPRAKRHDGLRAGEQASHPDELAPTGQPACPVSPRAGERHRQRR